MTNAEYTATQRVLQDIGAVALSLDLDAFLTAIARAEAAGPILDPTLYQKASPQLEQVKELARAVREVQRVAQRHTSRQLTERLTPIEA